MRSPKKLRSQVKKRAVARAMDPPCIPTPLYLVLGPPSDVPT